MRAEHTPAVARDAARNAPGLAKSPVWIEARNTRKVVGAKRTPRDAPSRKRNRKHHRLVGDHPPAAVGPDLGFAESRMTEAAEMADFVECDRLEVVSIRFARGRNGPSKRGVEEYVGLDD